MKSGQNPKISLEGLSTASVLCNAIQSPRLAVSCPGSPLACLLGLISPSRELPKPARCIKNAFTDLVNTLKLILLSRHVGPVIWGLLH